MKNLLVETKISLFIDFIDGFPGDQPFGFLFGLHLSKRNDKFVNVIVQI